MTAQEEKMIRIQTHTRSVVWDALHKEGLDQVDYNVIEKDNGTIVIEMIDKYIVIKED